ncbi:MAG: hypothetical protein EOO85_31605 [Pedobacter sp.]|nr:MAG: hypothetical protein EOO85_31605 [Pedobacter sp.]
MKTVEESLDNFGQILEALASQGKELNDNMEVLINKQPANYDDNFKEVLQAVIGVNGKLDLENLKAMLVSLNGKIEKIPKAIPVKHHHHLDKISKGLMIGIFVGFIFIAVLTGLSIYLLRRNASLALDSDKLLYLRSYNPEYLNRVDLAFASDRDSMFKVAEERILHQKQLQEAERAITEKEVELNKVRSVKEGLKNKGHKK